MTFRRAIDRTNRTPFNVRCGTCDNIWTAAYTPMPIMKFAELAKGLHCPSCGEDSQKIFPTKSDCP